MTVPEAILLGLVQGLTEFLPVSSSAHLRIVPELIGSEDPGAAFTAVIQLGTLLAVLLYFRSDIANMTRALWTGALDRSERQNPDFRLAIIVLAGTIPIIVLGLLLRDQIETTFRDLRLIGWTLIGFGLLMELADRLGSQARRAEDIRMRDGLLIGFAQALALVPGVSRSGATITMGRTLGIERAGVARFSFLLSVPAVVLSGLFEARHIGDGGVDPGAAAIATLVAFGSGYLSIAILLRFLQAHHVTVFTAWRVIAGVVVLVFLA